MLTLQEIFDKVAHHLLTQNKRATGESDTFCMYRTPEGLKCAVGCLIPDELYNKKIEGKSIGTLFLECVLPGIENTAKSCTLLWELRRLHDNYGPILWPEKLTQLARDFNLQWSSP